MASKPRSPESPRSQPQPPDYSGHAHSVQFYSDDAFLIDALSRFIGSALGAGDAAIVIATPTHRQQLSGRLARRGLDLEAAVDQGRYIALDAAETLAQFMVNGFPDEQRFVETIGSAITRAKNAAGSEHGRAAMFGEMVALLWDEGKTEAALRLEQLWNQIAQSHSFSLVCAYPLTHFYRADQSDSFLKICDQHSAVIPGEDYALAGEDERHRVVAHWQQRAQALEAEIERRRLSEATASKLAAIVQCSDDAIVGKDLNGIISSWNGGAEQIFGYKAEEIIGKSIRTIIPPELQSDEDMILGKIRSGERVDHFETVRVHKSGRLIDVSITVSPVRDSTGKIIGAAKIARDISERKNAEQALRRSEKLAATAKLAATVAHEINNPLQSLTNLLALVSYKSSLDENARQLCSLADSELRRLTRITRQLLALYRESAAPVSLKITEVLEDVLELFAMHARANRIRIERRYDSSAEIHAYPAEMQQLFAALIANSIEALPQRGRLVIHVSTVHVYAGRPCIRVAIADNGRGIAPDIRKRIFDPFFSTKAEKGAGLGLWVARNIVAKHEGTIRLRSSTKKRRGTTFCVLLPIESGWQLDISRPSVALEEAEETASFTLSQPRPRANVSTAARMAKLADARDLKSRAPKGA